MIRPRPPVAWATARMADYAPGFPWAMVGKAHALIFLAISLAGCGDAVEQAKGPQYSERPAEDPGRVYRMDILPQHNPGMLVKEYQPLIDYLNRHMPAGTRVEIGVPPDFKTFENGLKARAPEFLLGNPWHTVKAIDAGYHVIAMAGDAEDFKGIFIVRKDGGIKTPADLRGKAVSYPSPTALAAGMMPQWYLHTHGIDIHADTKSVYVGSQESSIMSVYLKQSAAGATWPPPWRQFQIDYPKEAAEMRVAWQTEPIVNNGVVARDDVPAPVRDRVRGLLLKLHESAEGRAILEGMQTSRFYPSDDAGYDKVRQFVARFEKEVRQAERK